MLPSPTCRPDYHALRCGVIGAVIAGVWWCPPGQAWALLTGTLDLGGPGGVLWREMLPRCGRTLALVVTATTLAASIGTLLAFLAASLGGWLSRVLAWAGQMLAAVPVAGAAWCAMAWLVNDCKLPVESLIPYSPPEELDTWSLALGRWMWTWAVPFWLLVLPLSGLWMSELVERLRLAWPVKNAVAMSARGLGGLRLRWCHWLRMAWVPLVDRWLRLCFIGLGFSISVEGVLGLPGWGSYVANSATTAGVRVAVSIYTGGWMMAVLCLLAWFVQTVRRHGEGGEEGRVPGDCQMFALPTLSGAVAAWLAPLLLWLLAVQPEPALWMKAVLGPWLEGLLPRGWVEPVTRHLPAVMFELGQACSLALKAGLLAVVIGTLTWGIRSSLLRPLPRFEWLSGLAWSPVLLLVMFCPAGGSEWTTLALIVAVADGAGRWGDRCAALEACGYVQASKALGLPLGRSVWRHGKVLLLPWLTGWVLRVAGTVIVWSVAVGSLLPGSASTAEPGGAPARLGGSISSAREIILTDGAGMVWPTVLAMVVTWCLWRLASVVSPARLIRE